MPEHTGTDPGDLPSKWQAPLKTSLTSIGMADSRIKKYEIKGLPHKSSTDPKDQQFVVSVRLRDENNKNLGTVHIHQDGTTNKK
ncbi:hypothetical protein MMC22_009868 [Lobaria immixta]|nr:hypothetical protein [Lobaria immixta]